MREIKFRAYHHGGGDIRVKGEMIYSSTSLKMFFENVENECLAVELMQFTGLLDKNGVEIYECMEIDEIFEVNFHDGCYVLINISNNDIIPLNFYIKEKNGQVKVTKEYAKV